MLRFLQFHEYEMIIAIVFLHYPDLQNRQLPPGMWFLHFGLEVAEGNQELGLLGLHAGPTDRHVHPGTGKGQKGKGEKCHSLRRKPLEWVHEVRAEGGIMQAPGFLKPLDAGIPPPCKCLAGLRS